MRIDLIRNLLGIYSGFFTLSVLYGNFITHQPINIMPITSSAVKALRASKRKRVFNIRRKNAAEKQLKTFRRLVAAKDKAGAVKLIPGLYQALDKAVKTDYFKANTAARLKSRAMAALKKLV